MSNLKLKNCDKDNYLPLILYQNLKNLIIFFIYYFQRRKQNALSVSIPDGRYGIYRPCYSLRF